LALAKNKKRGGRSEKDRDLYGRPGRGTGNLLLTVEERTEEKGGGRNQKVKKKGGPRIKP